MQNNFDYFTTTLSISPYKNSSWINEIGRNLENVIPIRETYNIYVSRFHCTIRRNDDGKTWMIYDGCWDSEHKVWNHSTNGTFVNSTQIQDSGYKLNVGDIITIGDTKIRFEEF